MPPTDYIESNALLALMDDDEDSAHRLLEELRPAELASLEAVADRLAFLCSKMYDAKLEKE